MACSALRRWSASSVRVDASSRRRRRQSSFRAAPTASCAGFVRSILACWPASAAPQLPPRIDAFEPAALRPQRCPVAVSVGLLRSCCEAAMPVLHLNLPHPSTTLPPRGLSPTLSHFPGPTALTYLPDVLADGRGFVLLSSPRLPRCLRFGPPPTAMQITAAHGSLFRSQKGNTRCRLA